jgi:hypothetical protein
MAVTDERIPQGFGSETPGFLSALAALQAELPKLPKDKTNPHRLVQVATGEGEAGRMPLLLNKDDMQGLGSAHTYARRYALSSVLNLVADEDDDGGAASGGYGHTPSQPAGTQNLQSYGKGISNPGLIAAFKQAGMEPPTGSPWAALTRVPEDKAQALYAALNAAKLAEGER